MSERFVVGWAVNHQQWHVYLSNFRLRHAEDFVILLNVTPTKERQRKNTGIISIECMTKLNFQIINYTHLWTELNKLQSRSPQQHMNVPNAIPKDFI